MAKSLTHIPEKFHANHPVFLQKIGKFFLSITGWKFKGDIPKDDRILLWLDLILLIGIFSWL